MLILNNCYSKSRLKSSLELMFMLYVLQTQNKSCLVFLSCSCLDIILLEIPEVKVFSKLHAVSGYWHIKPSQERQKFCTFNTPLRRYSRTKLPYELKCTREVNQRSVSNMVPDFEGCEAIVDNILIWEKDITEHDKRLKQVLNRLMEYNLKIEQGQM